MNAMVDQLEIRCPKLGGQVKFAYCRREQGRIPCGRIIYCWQARFPVESFLKSYLSEEEWERCFHESPRTKMDTLIELIEHARRVKENPDDSEENRPAPLQSDILSPRRTRRNEEESD